MSIDLTYAEFKATLVKLAEEKPDFIYKEAERDGENVPLCVNVELIDGKWAPSCLIGQAFVALGVEAEDMVDMEEEDAGTLSTYLEESGAVNFSLGWDYAHLRMLAAEAQQGQDRGLPWREAVTHAIRIVEQDAFPDHFQDGTLV